MGTSRKLSPQLLAIAENGEILSAAVEILWQAGKAEDVETLLEGVLPLVADASGGDFAVVVEAVEGRWIATGQPNAELTLPLDLAAEAVDCETAKTGEGWIAAPAGAYVLLVRVKKPKATIATVEGLAPLVSEAIDSVRHRHQNARRIRRLEAILRIANQWNQTLEVEPLLEEMAEAATRLLDADRASIFLWDKPNHLLVGRPALGIEGGELRIADDRGVVGHVIQTGSPRRVDTVAEPDQVDREVDKQQHYQTKTLLCVPMRDGEGELIGAFETINKTSGVFTRDDEEALIELAGHAAVALGNAGDRQRMISANRHIVDQAADNVQMIGQSPAIAALRSTIGRVAPTDLAVLITGENGTGKEVVAQSVHYLSGRRQQPFIAVNCAAIPDTLAESELFGHEKGAFTDAREARPGKFELADGGTLFLDEIGDLSLGSQAKMLRVLEEKVLVRVGGSMPIHTDARVLAATNQNLAEMVRNKTFREDLYFRLNVVTLELPPLRARGEDVMLLADHFLAEFCRKARRTVPKFSAEARKRLIEHRWSGNVRELRNMIERLAYLSTEDRIEAEELAFILSPRGDAPLGHFEGTLADATTTFQGQYIRQQIDQSSGNISRAADQLGLHRSNLYRKMRQLGMDPSME